MPLTVTCSQPGCTWSGPPADAATHDCPQTAETADDGQGELDAGSPPPAFASKEQLEQWLLENGTYSATGEPLNDETRDADQRYSDLIAAERDRELAAVDDGEPDLPDYADTPPRPWIEQISEQVQARDDVKQNRWAIVGRKADGTVELLDLAAVRSSADTAAELLDGYDGGVEVLKISELLKQAEALADLADPLREPALEHGDQVVSDEAEVVFDSQGRAIVDDDADGDVDSEQMTQNVEPAAEPTDPVRADTDPVRDASDEVAKPEPPTKTLFDASDYDREDLAVPKIDGNAIDRLALKFGGGVMLDRSEPKDVALYNRVHGQSTIELWVEAKWGGTAATPATNRDGDLDVIVGQKTLRIESIRIVDADALGALEGLELVRAAVRRAKRAGVPDDQIEQATIDTLAEGT